jgi:aminopeptidase N
VFRDQEFSSDLGSRAVERIAAVEYLRREQFAEDAGPMAHPVRPDEYQEINNFYTSTVYEKGAEVIRMQHTLLGPDAFRRGMDLYFGRFDGQAVTCDDFVQAMQDASGTDLAQFRRWYAQAGTPVVTARGRYDARSRTYTLELAQRTAPTPGQPRKLPFHVPVRMGLVGPDGRDLPLRLAGEAAPAGTTRVLSLTQQSEIFRFVDVPARPVPSLLRGFSAPVKLEVELSDGDLVLLAGHDSDPVNRWDAAQRAFAKAILRLAHAARAGEPLALPDGLAALVRRLLDDEASDPALIALALSLPDPAYVAALEPVLDVDAVTQAWRTVQRELALRHRAALERVEASRRPAGAYSPAPRDVALRSLANVCLRYLGAIDDAAVRRLARERYARARNMTDAIAALAALKDSAAAERDDLYAQFEARWRDEPLVLDKWFALQARSQREDALVRVKSLLAHPRFNARNPNRVRSLVGAFALGNFARFHAADGAGYEFTADQVLALDPANPQLASALAGAFNLWKRFAEPRRSAMQRALARIARSPGLSPDVREVVSRTLED